MIQYKDLFEYDKNCGKDTALEKLKVILALGSNFLALS